MPVFEQVSKLFPGWTSLDDFLANSATVLPVYAALAVACLALVLLLKLLGDSSPSRQPTPTYKSQASTRRTTVAGPEPANLCINGKHD